MFCGKCGAPIADGEKFCGKCGSPVATSKNNDLDTTDIPNASTWQSAPAPTTSYAPPMRMGGASTGPHTNDTHGNGQQPSTPKVKRPDKRVLIGAAAAICAVAVGIGIGVATAQPDSQPSTSSAPTSSSQSSNDSSNSTDTDNSSSSVSNNGNQDAPQQSANTQSGSTPANEDSASDSSQSSSGPASSTSNGTSETPILQGMPSDDDVTADKSIDYILPESNTRVYTKDELSSLDNKTLYYARNEIFARYGRGFKSQNLQDYFNSKSWYKLTYTPEQFDAMPDPLNATEKQNADTIKELETERQSPYAS